MGITPRVVHRKNLGVMKDQGKYYHIDILRVQEMATLRMGMNSLSTKHFYIHWGQRVDLR